MGPCMQRAPYSEALRTPVQDGGGCGAFQRNGPTGGAAKGMPLNVRTLPSALITPSSTPLAVRSCSKRICWATRVWMPNRAAMTNARFMTKMLSRVACSRARATMRAVTQASMEELNRKYSRRGHPTVDELIAAQDLSFPRDPKDLLGDFWPEEESIDDFLRALREWRGREKTDPAA